MSRVPVLLTHRERMSRYYGFQSTIYDATRWMFLFGRSQMLEDLTIRPGQTVMEIGCGTGYQFRPVLSRIGETGRLIAVDCSAPMLKKAARRARKNGWRNVEVMDIEYGRAPIHESHTDIVLMSYSLSMIPNWQNALKCAKAELRPGGTIGVVDFSFGQAGKISEAFADWLELNHVKIDRPYENVLTSMFEPFQFKTQNAFGGLWSYFRFVGVKTMRAGNAGVPIL